MLKDLRMRLAIWLSPELAAHAERHLAAGHAALANQRLIIAQTDALHKRGFKGTLLDYQMGVSMHQAGIWFKNKKAMETLMLPSPPTP